MSQTESLVATIRPAHRADWQCRCRGGPTFDRGCDQTRSDEGHLDRHVNVTNAAFKTRGDVLDIRNAGGDSFQPRTATGNRSEQCRSTLDLNRTDVLPCDRRRQQNLARLL